MDQSQILRVVVVAFVLLASIVASLSGADGTDINYGMLGANLPGPDEVVALYKSRNVTSLRLFKPNTTVLSALKNSGIDVILGTYNQDLQNLTTDASFADQWVGANIVSFVDSVGFRYITAGNEVMSGELASYVLPAIKNLDATMRVVKLKIPVTTAVLNKVLNASYPPSQGSFASLSDFASIVTFLANSNESLLVNAYPYFAYAVTKPASIVAFLADNNMSPSSTT